MNADSWRVVWTIAHNARKELFQRGVPAVLFAVAVLFFLRFTSVDEDVDLLAYIMSSSDSALYIAGLVAFIVSAGLFENEVGRRTIVAVRVHPVDAWTLLCGRLLGLLTWYLTLGGVVLGTGLLVAVTRGAVPNLQLVLLVAQSMALGATWITIGGTLGALLSPSTAVAGLAMFTALGWGLSQVGETAPMGLQYARQVYHFVSLVGPYVALQSAARSASLLAPRAAAVDGLRILDNILYAATVFVVGAQILERRDVPTRGA